METVSPALGEAVKDLRATHSGLMGELHQTAAFQAEQAHVAQQEANKSQKAAAEMTKEISQLESTIEQLDQVVVYRIIYW